MQTKVLTRHYASFAITSPDWRSTSTWTTPLCLAFDEALPSCQLQTEAGNLILTSAAASVTHFAVSEKRR